MTSDKDTIDRALAAAVRGGPGGGDLFDLLDPAALDVWIAYHGIAGLLQDHPARREWPAATRDLIEQRARGQAMWEVRHRALLAELLAALAAAGIVALLLKGSAIAYDLYAQPAARARGDSDVLIAPSSLDGARLILSRLGYRPHHDGSGTLDLQQGWSRSCDGGVAHEVDLHWQVLNTHALVDVLPFAEAMASPLELPRLSPDALAMQRAPTLLHTCLHRMMHVTAPYFANGQIFYGGDRLIWLNDISLLAEALTPPQWTAFADMAVAKEVAAACLAGLERANAVLDAPVPAAVIERLRLAAQGASGSSYLEASQAVRAWRDLRAISGLRRKLSYVGARAIPSAALVRGKYPRLAHYPLPVLYARRLVDLFRDRSRQSN